MKFTSVLLLAVISTSLLAALALEYPRPAPAFSAEITLQVSDHQHEEMYHGTMYHNSVARVQLIDVPADSFVRLERWDTGRRYDLNYASQTCSVQGAMNSEQANIWGWLSAAAWKGNYNINGVTCQQWEYSYSNYHFAGCFHVNTPVALAVASSSTKIQYYFNSFSGTAPSPSMFQPPSYCLHRDFTSTEESTSSEAELRKRLLELV